MFRLARRSSLKVERLTDSFHPAYATVAQHRTVQYGRSHKRKAQTGHFLDSQEFPRHWFYNLVALKKRNQGKRPPKTFALKQSKNLNRQPSIRYTSFCTRKTDENQTNNHPHKEICSKDPWTQNAKMN